MAAAPRPPWLYLPLELRAVGEWLSPLAFRRAMAGWPQGHGATVMVLPGFGQSDASTAALRGFLEARGFRAQGWGAGRNLGLRKGMTGTLLARAEALAADGERAPALIGWSLGGVIARELARKRPELFRRVISLGSPIEGGQATTIDSLFRRLNPAPRPAQEELDRRAIAPELPCTAIYTRSDGIVAWRAARERPAENTENIAVRGSHLGLGVNPLVWYACAHRLSPDTAAQPFSWPRSLRWLAPET